MSIYTWLATHEPKWKRRQPHSEQNLVPRVLFGEEDAATEWGHDSRPEQIFAPIASYDELKAHGALFLFGRRGTGKTALLYMLTHDVNSQQGSASKHYLRATLLQPVTFCGDLLDVLKGSCLSELGEVQLLSLLTRAWRWLIVSAAYLELARTFPEARIQGCELATNFHERIDSGQVLDGNITDLLTQEMLHLFGRILGEIPGSPNQLALTTISLREQLASRGLEQLAAHIGRFAKGKKSCVLVLVETEEIYQIDDRYSSAIRSALIDAITDFYGQFRNTGILAKAAFPSEIFPHLTPSNREKVENKMIIILWRYRDLVMLVAKRYYRLLNHSATRGDLERELKILDDYGRAKAYLTTLLPPRIPTRNRIEIDTLSYIIRHTQKKPRQLIAIFNCILTMAQDKGVSFSDLFEHPAVIRDAVHARLDTLVDGAFDIYRGIYPQADQIVRKALTGLPCYFSASDLDKAISQTNEVRSPSISRENVRQLLVQAGAIGVAVDEPTLLFRTDPPASVMEATFEYQVKKRLLVNQNSVCVVHPMFYEELQIKIDTTVLAYPKPTEEEEALLHSLTSFHV